MWLLQAVWDRAVAWVVEHWPMPGIPFLALVLLVVVAGPIVQWALSRRSLKRLLRDKGRRRVVAWWSLYTVMGAAGALVMIGATVWAARLAESRANLVRNPGFESATDYWGTGHLEDRVRNGNFTEEVEKLPYVVAPSPKQTTSFGEHDTRVWHRGNASFRFDHRSSPEDNHWGSLAQRINGLKTGRAYALTFWAKGKTEHDGAFFATTDLRWQNVERVPPTSEWKPYTLRFNAGSRDYTEIRFVITAPGTFWIDDVDVREVAE